MRQARGAHARPGCRASRVKGHVITVKVSDILRRAAQTAHDSFQRSLDCSHGLDKPPRLPPRVCRRRPVVLCSGRRLAAERFESGIEPPEQRVEGAGCVRGHSAAQSHGLRERSNLLRQEQIFRKQHPFDLSFLSRVAAPLPLPPPPPLPPWPTVIATRHRSQQLLQLSNLPRHRCDLLPQPFHLSLIPLALMILPAPPPRTRTPRRTLLCRLDNTLHTITGHSIAMLHGIYNSAVHTRDPARIAPALPWARHPI